VFVSFLCVVLWEALEIGHRENKWAYESIIYICLLWSMGEWGQCSRFFWVHVHFDGRYRPSTDFFLYEGTSTVHIDRFCFGMNPYRRSISTDFWVKSTVDQISTVFSSRWIIIDRRYRPYSQVGESLSTVDIDRDRSTGRLKSNRPIDDTCARFCQEEGREKKEKKIYVKLEFLLFHRVAFPTKERPLWYTARLPMFLLVVFFTTSTFCNFRDPCGIL